MPFPAFRSGDGLTNCVGTSNEDSSTAEGERVDSAHFRNAVAAPLSLANRANARSASTKAALWFVRRAGPRLGGRSALGPDHAVGGTTSGGADTTITEYSRSSSFTAPTLSVGLYGRWKLGEKWYLDSEVRGVYFKIENFKAGVAELGLAGRRFFSETFAAELGYNLGFYTVTLEKGTSGERFLAIDVAGKIKYTVNGFRAGAVFQF